MKDFSSYNILVAKFNLQLLIYSSQYELLWAVRLDSVAIKVIVCRHEDIKGVITILSDDGTLQLGYTGTEMPETMIEPLSEKIDMEQVERETMSYAESLKSNK